VTELLHQSFLVLKLVVLTLNLLILKFKYLGHFICLMMQTFMEKFRMCSFVQMFYCVDFINVHSVLKFYCLNLFACVCMMVLCGRCFKSGTLLKFQSFYNKCLKLFFSDLNIVTASLSRFLIQDCQVSVLSYITVSMCLISLGLLVITPSLLICRAWLYCHIVGSRALSFKRPLFSLLCLSVRMSGCLSEFSKCFFFDSSCPIELIF